jgi:hypothetical protein
MTCTVIDVRGAAGCNQAPFLRRSLAVRPLVTVVLLAVAAIHALPVVGVLGAARLESLYGLPVRSPDLEILLRHRAVLFGILAAGLAVAALRPVWHGPALVVGTASVVSFLALALSVGGYGSAIATVVRADLVALALLVAGGVAHVARHGAA